MTRDQVVKAAFQYRDALLTHAFAMLRDWAVAEDVVQDAFIVVMNKWQDFQPGTSVFLWVRRIVHLKSMEALRAPSRKLSPFEEKLLEQVSGAVTEFMGEEAAVKLGLRKKALRECMSQLGSRGAELVSGYYGRSKSCSQLATLQRRSVNAIRLALSRLRRQLHECVSRRLPSTEARG